MNAWVLISPRLYGMFRLILFDGFFSLKDLNLLFPGISFANGFDNLSQDFKSQNIVFVKKKLLQT